MKKSECGMFYFINVQCPLRGKDCPIGQEDLCYTAIISWQPLCRKALHYPSCLQQLFQSAIYTRTSVTRSNISALHDNIVVVLSFVHAWLHSSWKGRMHSARGGMLVGSGRSNNGGDGFPWKVFSETEDSLEFIGSKCRWLFVEGPIRRLFEL